jgi:hypothetical protein
MRKRTIKSNMYYNSRHWISIILFGLVGFSCKKDLPKNQGNDNMRELVDAREYEGLSYKDAIYHFVFSMSKPDLVADQPDGLAHFILIAPADRVLSKSEVALEKTQYEKAAIIDEMAMGANLHAWITDDQLIVSPSKTDLIQEYYAKAEKLPAAADLKSCRLTAMDADELNLKDAIFYLNERLNLSGSKLTIILDESSNKIKVSMYYKKTTVFDIIVIMAASYGFAFEQVNEKSLILKKT